MFTCSNHQSARRIAAAVLLVWTITAGARAAEPWVIDSPMPPPEWALLERALITANADACDVFFDRYFDERGYALCVERWGGDDGPDDASESFGDWPLLHALGASDRVMERFEHGWDGHLRQFTEARTTEVPFARDGMYDREFPVMFDWLHHNEGLRPFFLKGLSHPDDPAYRRRTVRFTRFYTGDDPTARNYDPERRIIRSLFNGSRGPLMRRATALDWAGDPIEVAGRFDLRHGERSYEEMLFHFKDYNDILGDHPQNLCATTLGLNAFMLTGDPSYRDWVLEYVDAWVERMAENDGIIPTKIGLDGSIGGPDGNWYDGVYGWAFSVEVPQDGSIAHRNTHRLGLIGFGNALLLTGDQGYVEPWRTMIDRINAEAKEIDGQTMYPTMRGDGGWYRYQSAPYGRGMIELYYWSMREEDLERVGSNNWIDFLRGERPDYPVAALRGDLEAVRRKVEAIRADETTPDTRLSDDILFRNPVSIDSLVELAFGGLPTGNSRPALHARLRYFDPNRRRAGLPPDVGALVEKLTAGSATVTLVNLNPIEARRIILQGGGYAEHQIESATIDGATRPIDASAFALKLAPGCGARVDLKMERYANAPTFRFPWDR